jgi:hypothetical protein
MEDNFNIKNMIILLVLIIQVNKENFIKKVNSFIKVEIIFLR